MNKAELIEQISQEANIHKNEAKKVTEIFCDSIIQTLKSAATATIKGFGTFSTINLAERKGHNPQTGEVIIIMAHQSVKFKTGKEFGDKISE